MLKFLFIWCVCTGYRMTYKSIKLGRVNWKLSSLSTWILMPMKRIKRRRVKHNSYGGILLPPTCKINYAYIIMLKCDLFMLTCNIIMLTCTISIFFKIVFFSTGLTNAILWHYTCTWQHNYVNMWLIYVNMQHNYVHMRLIFQHAT